MNRVELLKRNVGRLIVREEDDEERSTIFTQPGVEDEPLPIRKAKALALLLREVPVHIFPEELIVGIPFRERPSPEDPSVRMVPPEGVSGQGYIDMGRRLISIGLSEEPYHPVIPSLRGYGASDRFALFPHYATAEEIAEARRFGLAENSNPGHLQGGHARVIAHGWSGLKEMAERALSEVDPSTELGRRQETFLRSVVISLEAAQAFALRYADLAEEMAEREESPRRRRELQRISEVCRNVSERRPETWWEALQLNWFTHLINHAQGAHQLGRFDQYMWPVLERDLKEGRITREEAQELLECLWIKYSMLTDYTMDNLQNLILGGQTPDGRDATNPLSYMCLEAIDKLGTIDPKWSIRVHGDSPEEFLRRACEIIKSGKSQPGIYNDEIIIAALQRAGVPLEDARDYTNDGCSEVLVQGKSTPWAFEGKVKLLKCLERAMTRLEEHDSFDDLMAALKDEISIAVSLAVSSVNLIQHAVPKISPNPWVSASVEGCIEKKMDLTEGGATYNYSAICASGVADVADSLAAVKKLVYEEGRVGRRELLEALRNNFEGRERLRLMLLNRAPKFGNDDDYVDSLAAEIVEHTAREVTKHRNPRGGTYTLGLFSYGDYIGHGMVTGATPDGRRAGTGISPNFSPSPGRDAKGPFAAMKSTAKVDQRLTANGTALDLTIHPSALRGPEGTAKLVSLIRAFNKLGGMQVQFNIVDGETLRAAQLEPEKYRNLTVRLWGFPAYFTRLPREFQDHIIARTEHIL
ncbi:MAG: pyruvate formate lyase family protein [Candidatus Bathyarchaeia archaeon]